MAICRYNIRIRAKNTREEMPSRFAVVPAIPTATDSHVAGQVQAAEGRDPAPRALSSIAIINQVQELIVQTAPRAQPVEESVYFGEDDCHTFGDCTHMTDNIEDRLLTQKELAERWNITPRTLQLWHSAGKGPKRVNIGRGGYRLSDVLKYEEEQAADPGTKRPPTHVFKEEHRALGVEAGKLSREALKTKSNSQSNF